MLLIQLIQMHRNLQIRIKIKSIPVGPASPQGPIQIIQNVPVQPIPQQVPIQLAPAGIMPVLRFSIKIG